MIESNENEPTIRRLPCRAVAPLFMADPRSPSPVNGRKPWPAAAIAGGSSSFVFYVRLLYKKIDLLIISLKVTTKKRKKTEKRKDVS